MDPKLLKYYETELKFLREMGGEFAHEFPKIAGRLGLSSFECADPYVERLLEGCAFLTSRLQLRMDAEFPKVTQHLLEMVYPHYLAPTPSMVVVNFSPDMAESALVNGYDIPENTSLRSLIGKGDKTPCEFRTSQGVTLWPIEISQAAYLPNSASMSELGLDSKLRIKAGIRIKLKSLEGHKFSDLSLDNLVVYLRGDDEFPMRIYEQIFSSASGFSILPAGKSTSTPKFFPAKQIKLSGFSDDQSLLPASARSFSGYRLLHEYFSFPTRFMFFELIGINEELRKCNTDEVEVIIPLDNFDPILEHKLDSGVFSLFCTPAINLFSKRSDRIHLDKRNHEYHVVPDRTRPMDYEVHSVMEVNGYGDNMDEPQSFHAFYSSTDLSCHQNGLAYYSVSRERRKFSNFQKKYATRMRSYVGSEVFLSLVDSEQTPYSSELKQLAVKTLCTNRDLPLHMPLGLGKTDFNIDTGAPVLSVRCLAGPSKPRPSFSQGETAWRLVSHLSLNYLSLLNSDNRQGAEVLRELLTLYNHVSEPHIHKQIEGVHSINTKSVTRRLPVPGPVTYGRGLEVAVTLDDVLFQGTGIYLLGAILEEFFSRYVSINSFTETVLHSTERGEIKRWPIRIGRRHIA